MRPHQRAPSMLLGEETGCRAIIGSHVIIVRIIPLLATENQSSKYEKREI